MRPAADIPGLRRAAKGALEALGPLAPLAPPIAAISVLGLSLSMSLPLFALLLEREGFSGTVIGLNSMAAPLAMVLSSPFMPRALRLLGLIRLTTIATVTVAITFTLIPFVEGLVLWTVLRSIWGICTTALFFAVEFWVVAAAPAAARGRAIAVYAIVLSGTTTLGPLMILVTGQVGALPFLVAAAIAILSLPVLVRGAATAPDPEPEGTPKLAATLRFFVSDPALLWAVVLFGAIEYGMLSLIPVWGVRSGMSAEAAVVLISVFTAGAMVLLLPLGWAADRFDPRRLLALTAAISLAAPIAVAAVAPSAFGAALPMLLWGGFGAGLYTIALTALGERYTGARLAEANAAVTLAYGVGALLAPGLLGLAMDRIAPPHGMLYGAAVAAALYLALIFWRMARAKR
ncbi:MAG: MFS transporter [Pseudomonadota bacterium]